MSTIYLYLETDKCLSLILIFLIVYETRNAREGQTDENPTLIEGLSTWMQS